MKYDDLTKRYANWLFLFVDRHGWGYRNRRNRKDVPFTNESWLLERYWTKTPGCFPQKLTKTFVQAHLKGEEQLHYANNRSCGFALITIDVDAHRKQPDALETAQWIQAKYFPNSYLEASERGYHLYLVARVGMCSRPKFNRILDHVQTSLSVMVAENGYTSTVEVKPSFMIREGNEVVSRGTLACAPTLPHGMSDMESLLRMPIYLISALRTIFDDAIDAKAFADELFTTDFTTQDADSISPEDTHTVKQVINAPIPEPDACAWMRMKVACFRFCNLHKRVPDTEELLEYYQALYSGDGAHRARIRRARYAVRYYLRIFDPSKASAGYDTCKEQLLEAVQQHCVDRANKCETTITDEDLALGLYVVQRNSFCINDSHRLQWTCGYEAFTSMIAKLKAEGLTKRSFRKRNKIRAVKEILERGKLIECIDRRYIAAGKEGVSMKYAISTNHWRYAEFVKWSADVQYRKVGDRQPTEEPRYVAAGGWELVQAKPSTTATHQLEESTL